MKKYILFLLMACLLGVSVFLNITQLDRNKLAKVIAKEDAVLLQNKNSKESIDKDIPLMTADSLCEAFNSDKESAQKNYASRYIVITGKIEEEAISLSQGTNILGKTQVSITFMYRQSARKSGWFDYNKVVCSMLAGQNEIMKNLKVGDEIKLKGLMNGSIGKTIVIDGCILLEQ